MPYINRAGVQIYYETHGSGTPLLLSHGYSATTEMWTGQVNALSKEHTLILWDMRGHGRSDYPEDQSQYSEAHTVADMDAILTQVCGSQKAIVGGLSLGGYMSLAYYRVHPERVMALLIIDTGPGFKKDAARDDWNIYANKTAEGFERDGLARLQRGSSSIETQIATHRDAKGLVRAARGMLAQRNSAVINSLTAVRVPSLVVVGADDKPFIAASNYMTKSIPGAKKVVIPKAGHAANIDQPETFNKCILEFLGTVESSKGKL